MKTLINIIGIGVIVTGSIVGKKTQKLAPTLGLIGAGALIIYFNSI